MGFMKRAVLYVTQKKGKSVLLFVILFTMATFVLTGLTIWKASGTAQKNLRQALGGQFQVRVEYSKKNPHYVEKKMGSDLNLIAYTKMPITDEMIARIAKTKGIKTVNASAESLVSIKDMEFFKGTIPIEEEFRKQTTDLAVSDTKNNSYFSSGSVSLVAGRHIVPGDAHTAVISEDLAQKNKLAVGDALTFYNPITKDEIKVKVVGLFKPKKIEDISQQVTAYQKIQNRIFTDIHTATELEKEFTWGFNKMDVTVEDPSELNAIASEIKAIPAIDWSGYAIETNNQHYEAAASPLERLDELVSTLLIIIAAVSAIILSLILTMWARSRIHETGVFLSVGIGKTAIVGQYFAEVLFIAVLAFGLSFFSSNVVANQIGDSLLQQQKTQVTQAGKPQLDSGPQTDSGGTAVVVEAKGESSDSSTGRDASDEIAKMDIKVNFENMIQLYLIGFSVIILSVGISSIAVMRLKPREILSKMS